MIPAFIAGETGLTVSTDRSEGARETQGFKELRCRSNRLFQTGWDAFVLRFSFSFFNTVRVWNDLGNLVLDIGED